LPLFGFGPDLRARWPLMIDAQFPAGRLQPYVTGGPTWAFSLNDDSLKVEFGGKVGVGVAYNIVPMFAIFSEYRYTFYPGFNLTDRHTTYSTDIDTHGFLVGGSLRF
jgi:opacity protein-like surface antigen